MALMDVEYRSLRILDSLTMKSANSRTLSASSVAEASFCAKDLNLSMVSWQKRSGVCLVTESLVTLIDFEEWGVGMTGSSAIRVVEAEADRLWGGGVGKALGAIDEDRSEA